MAQIKFINIKADGKMKNAVEKLTDNFLESAGNSDLNFLLVARSKNEGINIVAGVGSKKDLKNYLKQVKTRIKEL